MAPRKQGDERQPAPRAARLRVCRAAAPARSAYLLPVDPARSFPPRATYVASLLVAFGLFAAVFLPLWKPLFLAGVLAAALMGWEDRLSGRLRGYRSLAAGLLTLAVVLLVVAPLATVGTVLVKEILGLVQSAQETFAEKGLGGIIALLPDRFEGLARRVVAKLPRSWDGLARQGSAQGAAAAGVVSSAFSQTSALAFDAAMMLVALFFLLVDGRRLIAWVCRVSPLGADTTAQVLGDLRRTGTSVLTSLLATAAVQGVVATLGYLIARVPQPLVFGLLTFFAAFIPSVGTSIVALPIALVLLLSGRVAGGVFLAVWAILVTGTIDNVLKPLLARSGVNIHGGVIFFAMIGGILAFGALGLLLGPLAVSLLLALVHVRWRDVSAPRERNVDEGAERRRRAPASRPSGLADVPVGPEHDA
jgi:predicted PurR-regulated permease PerM